MYHCSMPPSQPQKPTPLVSYRMAATAQRDNSQEIQLRSALHRRGLRFRVHCRLIKGSRRTVDIVLPGARIAVFVDGCFWHGCSEHGSWPKRNAAWWRAKILANIQRDRDTDTCLCELGWHVIRVWEHELVEIAAEAIAAVVRNTKSRVQRT